MEAVIYAQTILILLYESPVLVLEKLTCLAHRMYELSCTFYDPVAGALLR